MERSPVHGTALRVLFRTLRLIFMVSPHAASRGRCVGRLFCEELREVPPRDGLAEAELETVLLAGHLVHAAGLQVFAAEAATDTHRQICAVATLLPWPKRDERRDFFGNVRSHRRDLESRQARYRGALVDAPLGIDRVVVLPVQLARAEHRLQGLAAEPLDPEAVSFDALVELDQHLWFLLVVAPRAGRVALLGIDDGFE